MSEKAKKVKFVCRQCGCEEYNERTEDNGMTAPSYREWVIGYECAGCSVRFGSVEKFSIANKKK